MLLCTAPSPWPTTKAEGSTSNKKEIFLTKCCAHIKPSHLHVLKQPDKTPQTLGSLRKARLKPKTTSRGSVICRPQSVTKLCPLCVLKNTTLLPDLCTGMSLTQEITFLNCKTVWFSKQNPTMGVHSCKSTVQTSGLEQELLPGTRGCHLDSTESFIFTAAAQQEQAVTRRAPSLVWIPLRTGSRAQGKANSLECCPC